MSDQFFCLKPSTELYKFIIACKEKARILVGEQLYLKDFPHLTLYVGRFKKESIALEPFKVLLNKLLPTEIILKGWSVFWDDPVTDRHTLVIEVEEESLRKLREVQKVVVEKSEKYRTLPIISRYADSHSYSKEMKYSLRCYGFPFIGDIWRGHFTIASFKKNVFSNVYKELKRLKVPSTTKIDKLCYNDILVNSFEEILSWDF